MQFVKQREDLGYPATETLQERDGVTGDTPLHKAVENNQEELVKWLLLQGVMPDVKDNHGVTPLHVAAIKGYFSLVELLLDSDESIKKGVDSNGDTAVHWAATKGHLDVVELLLSRGAAIDIANKQGWTALHRAAFNGRVEVMDRLLNAGASLHAVNQDCNTALHLASHNNHLSAISLLLKWGAKTDMRNAEGLVPVFMGVSPGVRDIIEEWEIAHPPKSRTTRIEIGAAKPATPPRQPPRSGSARSRPRAPETGAQSPSGPPQALAHSDQAAAEDAASPALSLSPSKNREAGAPNLAMELGRLETFSLSPSKTPGEKPKFVGSRERMSYRPSLNRNPSGRRNSQNDGEATRAAPEEDAVAHDKPHGRHLKATVLVERQESEGKMCKRPTWNKKFLKNYNLEKYGLFAP